MNELLTKLIFLFLFFSIVFIISFIWVKNIEKYKDDEIKDEWLSK